MSPDSRDPALLWDMLDAAQNGRSVIAGHSFDEFAANLTLRLAMERTMEILGEAARQVSPMTRDAHPEIPWRLIVGQRNILAHEYGRIDHRQLYRTATEDLPDLIEQLRAILGPD
jgi:uncharacterized protein with HEPN domain